MFRIIRRVINWLITLVPEVIIWPEGNDVIKVGLEFQDKTGIPNCIGAIDGSHINIKKPEERNNSRQYSNRKQRYSILLQAVCDTNMKFLNIYCGDPGSYHDVRMLRRSNLFLTAERNRGNLFPNRTFLLGDKAYNGVAKTIVCPFKDNGNLTAEQEAFNTRISTARIAIEKAFGVLKGRFLQLQELPLRNIHDEGNSSLLRTPQYMPRK